MHLPGQRGYQLITGPGGVRHLVDAGGIRYLTETEPDRWDLAISAGNWAAIRQFAEDVLATPDPDGRVLPTSGAFLPPLPATVTDQITAQMCTETGHSCIACPQDARNLGATAHNALGAVRNALNGSGSWERAQRKLGELERALAAWEATAAEHFGALESWRKPLADGES